MAARPKILSLPVPKPNDLPPDRQDKTPSQDRVRATSASIRAVRAASVAQPI
ncbi:hypothetical protein CIRG_05403 [Coccidioides immitis RMSCC 2394]|uniref:Uncharacterized protein n=2 Tax=Coccidioides TaxID=5500 RepID=A0A0J7B6Y2_COCIT|nr:hypothetical protein CPAG_07321 [Coccidioides posadasii RMSCC 3488]KMP05722.1 hypothetical protein CIRG_05403 [Coccidioides immitis RMSCC 2394]